MKKEKQKLETNLWTLSIYQSIHKEIFNDINWNVYVWLTKQIKKKLSKLRYRLCSLWWYYD